jgi:acylphosphatase
MLPAAGLAAAWCLHACSAPPSAATRAAATTTATATATAPATTSAPTRPAVRRVHVFLSGRVQGVGFRNFTQRWAGTLKINGWVRNLRDRRVEAVFEGPTERVAELIEKVKRGPGMARVTGIEIKDEPYQGEFKSFRRLPTK